MTSNMIKNNWTEIKGKIKEKWDKFNDIEIERVKENLELISEKIQSLYGYAKERADQEFKEFKVSIESFITDKDLPISEKVVPHKGTEPSKEISSIV